MSQVSLDVTPWIRAPLSGVGQVTRCVFEALRALPPPQCAVIPVARVKADRPEIQNLSFREKILGTKDRIYHSLELKLPPLCRSRSIVTVYDTWTLRPNPFQTSSYQRRQAPKLRRALEKAEIIVAHTEFVMKQLREWDASLETRIQLVPLASTLKSDSIESTLSSAVERYLSGERPYVLCVACIETRKNQKALIEAMARLKDVDLVLVGGFGFGAEEMLRHHGLLGERLKHFSAITPADLKALYAGCRLFALLSLEEGFGLPVVEALEFGIPLVLSDIPAFREVAGDAALFVSPAHADDAADRIHEAVTNEALRLELGIRSKKAGARFQWANAAYRFHSIYETLANKSR